MNERKQGLLGLALVTPSFLSILLFIAYPVIQTVLTSFTSETHSGFTLENYYRIFTDKESVGNTLYTLFIVAVTVILSTVIAYLLSIYLTYGNSRIAAIIRKIYIIPQFIPGIVAVYATINIMKDTGALNRFMLLFGVNFKPSLMYTANGIILMNLWFNIPFSAMIISSAIGGIPISVIESARDVGAGKFMIFMKMIFPLSYKSTLLATVMVFMGNVGAYTAPSLIGSNSPRMLGVDLYQEFTKFYDIPYSSALSVVMFLLCLIAGLFYIRTMMKENEWEGKS